MIEAIVSITGIAAIVVFMWALVMIFGEAIGHKRRVKRCGDDE